MYDGKLKVTEERRQRLADRQKEEAKAMKAAEEEEEKRGEKKKMAADTVVDTSSNSIAESPSEATAWEEREREVRAVEMRVILFNFLSLSIVI